MNQLTIPIVGNITGDPELKFTPSGAAICRFTVAHNPRHFDKTTNEWKEGEATFLDCTAWRELAEHLGECLASGTRVILIGNLKTRSWESDGSGKTPAGTKISRMSLDVLAGGPELTYATAEVKRVKRNSRGEIAPDDPWATASRTRPAAVMHGGDNYDEPPF